MIAYFFGGFMLMLFVVSIIRYRNNKRQETEAKQTLFDSEGVQALLQQDFEANGNLVIGTRDGFTVGVYYRVRHKPEYFTFINCNVPRGVSNMMTFNRKYKDENIAIDSRTGFCQELTIPLTIESINTSLTRLITIAQTENFELLKD